MTDDKLIELERADIAQLEELERRRAALREMIGAVDQAEKEHKGRLAEIRAERARIKAEEDRKASEEQAERVSSELSALERKFLARAQGKVWYEGDGEAGKCFDFQLRGAMFGAAAKRWILGDEMGLGKTRQAIGWLDLVGAKKVLVVCEPNVCSGFAGEVMELAPHRSVVNLYRRTPARRHQLMDEIEAMDECVVVVNFEIWRRDKDLLERMASYRFDTLIVDEAHNLKTTSTSNYKHIEALVMLNNTCANCGEHIYGLNDPTTKKLRPCAACGWTKGAPTRVRKTYPLDIELSTKSIQNICLTTGTPILNSPLDLYSLLHLCDPLLFKSKKSFTDAFLIKNHHSGKIEFRDGGMERLKPLIRGRYLARTKDEVGIVLPAQRHHIVRVDVDPEQYPLQYRTIKQVSERAQIVLDSGERLTIMDVLALITRKRQANVWPGGIEVKDAEGNVVFSVGAEVRESAKMDEVVAKIVELHAEGRRQAVFSQFSTALDELAQRLEAVGLRVAVMTGKTAKVQRDRIKNNFYRAKGEEALWDVVLCNYKTGGTGLNLTAVTATHEIDEEWNPGKRDQSRGRTNRIGQTEENDVFTYRVPASVDTWMANIIRRKEQIIEGFKGAMIDGDELSAASLSNAMKNGEIL